MTVFGIINEVGGFQGLITFILVLALLVLLEYLFKTLGTYALRHGYETIYEKLKKELTILGIISFSVFIYQAAAGGSQEEYFVAFELAHIIVLFIAIAFIAQALLLVHYASIGGQKLLGAIRTPFEDLVDDFKELHASRSSFSKFCFNYMPNWLPFFPKLRNNIEYRIIEKFFLSQHPLPSGFRFSKYATILFTDFISELGDVGPFSWACIGVFVGINYGRIIFLDSIFKSDVCTGYGAHGAGHTEYNATLDDHHDEAPELSHFEHALATGCVDYTLGYGLFCGFALTLFILILYIISGIYYDRMIFKILQWDKVDIKKPGRQMYLDFLEAAETDEKQFKNLTQGSILNFSGVRVDSESGSPRKRIFKNSSSRRQSKEPSNDRSAYRNLTQVGDIYKAAAEQVAQMSIEDYKREMDYNKLKLAHEHEVKMSRPFYIRFYLDLKEMFTDAPESPLVNPSTKERPKTASNAEAAAVGLELARPRTDSIVSDPPESEHKQRVIENIFIFRSPRLHIMIVELALLIQCFYVSVWGTQLMPLTSYAKNTSPAVFIALSTFLIVLTSFLQESILHQTVMLQTVIRLHVAVVDKVCDQSIEEANVLSNMRRSIIEQLENKSSNKRYWRKHIKDKFNEYNTSQNGFMDSKQFRNFLGSLNIFMPKERFDIIWESVDYDQSGAITWDELFVLVFPEFKYDLKEQMDLLEDLRQKLKHMLKTKKQSSRKKQIKYLETVFKSIDKDGSSFIEKDEFETLLEELGMTGYTEKQFHMMFLAADSNADDKLSFAEFCEILHLHVVDDTDLHETEHEDASDEKSDLDVDHESEK